MVFLKGSDWKGAQSRSSILSQDGIEPAYVVNLKPSVQASRKLKVWAVHFLKFENVGQNYDVL